MLLVACSSCLDAGWCGEGRALQHAVTAFDDAGDVSVRLRASTDTGPWLSVTGCQTTIHCAITYLNCMKSAGDVPEATILEELGASGPAERDVL
jgi:hypothetical protein